MFLVEGGDAVHNDAEKDEIVEVTESEEEEYWRTNFQSISLTQFDEVLNNPYPVTLAEKRKTDKERLAMNGNQKIVDNPCA